MIRALFIGASGMTAQQLNIDVISNNLANTSTTGFKKSRAEFEDLLYQDKKFPGAISNSATDARYPTGSRSASASCRPRSRRYSFRATS